MKPKKTGVPTKQILAMKARGFWPAPEVAEGMKNHVQAVYRHCEAGHFQYERMGKYWYVKMVSVRKYLGDSQMDAFFGKTVGR